jgi:glycopeptide antibiotics resistance protein
MATRSETDRIPLNPYIGFAWLAGMAVVTLLLLIRPFGDWNDFRIVREIQNAGHIPVFALFAIGFGRLLRSFSARLRNRRLFAYQIGCALAVIFGLGIEGAQYFSPRDADLVDGLRNLVGALAGYGIARLWRRETIKPSERRGWYLAIVVALVFSAGPILYWSYAYYHRASNFPVLLKFDSSWDARFLHMRESELAIVSPPESMSSTQTTVGALSLFAGEYPGLTIEEPCRDWSSYSTLRVSIYSPYSDTLPFAVRIDDRWHNGLYEDRYSGRFSLLPGRNEIAVDLEQVRMAPQSRETDMGNIGALWLFMVDTKREYDLYIESISLDR